jgi:diguanylate cyclase (GGDEF)-like protein
MDNETRIGALEATLATATDVPDRVRALNALGTELARTGYAKRAIALAQEARTLADSLGDPALVASTVHGLARCYFYLADFVAALELLLEAARAYQDLGDFANATMALAGVGLCQHRLGAQEDAVASLLHALESAQQHGFVPLQVNIHNSLGSALLAAGRTDDAARHLAVGIERAREDRNDNLLTKLLLNQSLVWKRRGDDAADPDEAIREYEQSHAMALNALAHARELGNRYDEAHCLGQSGSMLRLLGRPSEAEAALKRALALGRELDEAHVQAEAMLELGRLYANEDGERARRCLYEAITLAERMSAKAMLADVCEALSTQCEREGDAATALTMYKRFHSVRETEFAMARRHAARAAQLWIDFQQATRQATQYREQAKLLAEDKAVLARQAEELTAASQQDPLTGLLNRRGLDAQIVALVATCERNNVPLTVALIDIDRFKEINDTFSHPIGDVVLKRVASIIRAHCRINDLPVRYGGDEFLVVLAGADRDGSALVLNRLKDAVDDGAWDEEAAGLRVSLSIGAATREANTTIAATIFAADRALYLAKSGGRDRIVVL